MKQESNFMSDDFYLFGTDEKQLHDMCAAVDTGTKVQKFDFADSLVMHYVGDHPNNRSGYTHCFAQMTSLKKAVYLNKTGTPVVRTPETKGLRRASLEKGGFQNSSEELEKNPVSFWWLGNNGNLSQALFTSHASRKSMNLRFRIKDPVATLNRDRQLAADIKQQGEKLALRESLRMMKKETLETDCLQEIDSLIGTVEKELRRIRTEKGNIPESLNRQLKSLRTLRETYQKTLENILIEQAGDDNALENLGEIDERFRNIYTLDETAMIERSKMLADSIIKTRVPVEFTVVTRQMIPGYFLAIGFFSTAEEAFYRRKWSSMADNALGSSDAHLAWWNMDNQSGLSVCVTYDSATKAVRSKYPNLPYEPCFVYAACDSGAVEDCIRAGFIDPVTKKIFIVGSVILPKDEKSYNAGLKLCRNIQLAYLRTEVDRDPVIYPDINAMLKDYKKRMESLDFKTLAGKKAMGKLLDHAEALVTNRYIDPDDPKGQRVKITMPEMGDILIDALKNDVFGNMEYADKVIREKAGRFSWRSDCVPLKLDGTKKGKKD